MSCAHDRTGFSLLGTQQQATGGERRRCAWSGTAASSPKPRPLNGSRATTASRPTRSSRRASPSLRAGRCARGRASLATAHSPSTVRSTRTPLVRPPRGPARPRHQEPRRFLYGVAIEGHPRTEAQAAKLKTAPPAQPDRLRHSRLSNPGQRSGLGRSARRGIPRRRAIDPIPDPMLGHQREEPLPRGGAGRRVCGRPAPEPLRPSRPAPVEDDPPWGIQPSARRQAP